MMKKELESERKQKQTALGRGFITAWQRKRRKPYNSHLCDF